MTTEVDDKKDSFNIKANVSQFFITIQGQPDGALSVLEYEVEEYSLSNDFMFRVNTLSDDVLPPKDLINKKVTIITKRGTTEQVVHGIIVGMQSFDI